MFDRIANVETDAELKTRAMNYILREICRKNKDKKDPIFTQEEVHKSLRGLGPGYIDLNIHDLFKGSDFIDIDDEYNLTLTDKGKQFCENERR